MWTSEVPNQAIYFTDDNIRRVEDDIIAKTWNHFFRNTKDVEWWGLNF